jgi:HEAT repeat protein
VLSEALPSGDGLSLPSDAVATDARAAADERRHLLGSDGWIRSVAGAGYRWRQPALEEILARPAAERPDFPAALAEGPVVAANAAICLARLNDAAGVAQLAAAIRDPQLKLPLRLAVAETLGRLQDPAAKALVGQLVDRYAQAAAEQGGPYLADLHAELIRGLGHAGAAAAGDRRMIDAFRAESAAVRLAALEPWRDGPCGPLPIEAVDLRSDPDPNVRIAALGALARQRHPTAVEYLAVAMDDCDFQVRLAAVAGLGQLGGSEGERFLIERLRDEAELIRAAAVSALAELGSRRQVLSAATDRSWRVRAAVARELGRYPDQDGTSAALLLVGDPSAIVQGEVVAAVREWPLTQSGPVLLKAMESTGYETRHAAARRLARAWAAAGEYPVDGPAERRKQVLADLVRQFEREFPPAEPSPAAVHDPSVVPAAAVEHVAGSSQIDARTEERLERLASFDVSIRRKAANELAVGPPPGPAATSRLADLILKEPDPLVWQSVLAAVHRDPGEASTRLAYAALGHPSAEVRRRACEHLAAHPSPSRAAVLVPSLEDPIDAVRLAAVEALAAAGRLDDAEPLKRLLASSNAELRLAAAEALCRVQNQAGPAALERLSLSDDPAERRRAAEAMGRIGDPSLAGALVRLLDDRPNVRTAALESLVKLAGRDVAANPDSPPPDAARQNELWKNWLQSR